MKLFSFLITLPILKRLLPSLLRTIIIFIGKDQFQIKFKNLVLETNIRDPHDREIFFTQKYEELQFIEIFDCIKNNSVDVFMDVGANSGIYSLRLSNKFKDLIIFAFEPVNDTFQKFLKNIENNNLGKNINAHNFGLSNKESKLNMKTNIKYGYKQSAGYHVSEDGDSVFEFKSAELISILVNASVGFMTR